MELIDKKALIDEKSWDALIKDYVTGDIQCVQVVDVGDIEEFPTVDAVPVVRCKDCKYSLPNDGKLNDGARYCSRIYGGAKKEHPAVWDMDYCSGGERKEVQG